MASHTELPYTEISGKDAVKDVLETTGHYSGHVNILCAVNGKKCLLVGHNRKHENVAMFGGFPEPGETLLQTIKRETSEESLDCIMTPEELEYRLRDSATILTRESRRGRHYTAFIDMGEDEFPLEAASACFLQKSKLQKALTKGQKENDSLHALCVETLQRDDHGMMDNVSTTDVNGTSVFVRSITMPAYRHAFPRISAWFH